MISKSITRREIKSPERPLSFILIGQDEKIMLTLKVSLIGVASSKGHFKLLEANLNLMKKERETSECIASRLTKTCASKDWTRSILNTMALDACAS